MAVFLSRKSHLSSAPESEIAYEVEEDLALELRTKVLNVEPTMEGVYESARTKKIEGSSMRKYDIINKDQRKAGMLYNVLAPLV